MAKKSKKSKGKKKPQSNVTTVADLPDPVEDVARIIPRCSIQDQESNQTLTKPNTSLNPIRAKITDLPMEVIIRMLPFCEVSDLEKLCETSWLFHNACKRIPRLSARQILSDLYNGKHVDIGRICFVECKSLWKEIVHVYCSDGFRNYMTFGEPESDVEETRFVLLAVILESLHPGYDIEDYEDLLSEVRHTLYALFSRKGKLPTCFAFQHAPNPEILTWITPDFTEDERFTLAMGYGNVSAAYHFLERIFGNYNPDAVNPRKVFQSIATYFLLHPKMVLKMLFLISCSSPKHYKAALFTFEMTRDLIQTLIISLNKGNMDLNNWFHQLVCWVMIGGSVDILKMIMGHPAVDPSRWDSFPLACRLSTNSIDAVLFLLQDQRVDPTSHYNAILDFDAEGKDIELFKALYANPNFKRDCNDTTPLKKAAMRYNMDLFRYLMSDPQLNLQVNQCQILLGAVVARQPRFVKALINDPRIDPTIGDHRDFKMACAGGDIETLKVFIEHPKVDPSADMNEPIKFAIGQGHIETAKWLLSHPKVNPGAHENDLIIWYVTIPDPIPSVFAMLLKEPRIDPSARDNEALRYAFSELFPHREFRDVVLRFRYTKNDPRGPYHPLLEIADMLLKHPKVKNKLKSR